MEMKLEHCQIHPSPPAAQQELSLPLTHFDIPFLLSDPTLRVIFFDFPCSKSYFLETIVPDLKKSLSTTLTHFLPLAGNIIVPLNSDNSPVNCYTFGDSVSLTIAQCDKDFHYLTGNDQRLAEEFYACIPQLGPASCSPESVVLPVIALQITLFEEQGICLGLTNHHAGGDESSIVNFVKLWALINRCGGDSHVIDGKSLPVFDRSLLQDPRGLNSKAWNLVKRSRPLLVDPRPISVPNKKVRATFILTKNEVQNLKNYVLRKRPNLSHISCFSVICAYVWTCAERAGVAAGEEVNDDELVHFSTPADCRLRLNPPLPSTYFGSCVVFVIAQSRHGLLKGDEGFLIAAESIGEAIQKTVYSEKGILDSVDWPRNFKESPRNRVISVAGSPRFNVYEADYGWGIPKKYEFVHIDKEKSISLCKSRNFEGGFEIGLSRTKIEMDAFEGFFNQGLEIMKSSA